jgi:putative hydrolase of the HAD superfamily
VVRAVLFDLDDTLLVDEPAVVQAFVRTLEDAGTELGKDADELTDIVRAEADRSWRASPLHSIALQLGFSSDEGLTADFVGGHPVVDRFVGWVPEYRRAVWRTAMEQVAGHPIHKVADRLAERFRTERRGAYELARDAGQVLATLQQLGMKLGIVTNGPPDLQREKLERTRLVAIVHAVVISGEVGVGKPDRRVFNLALDLLGVPAAEAVMVGDSIERDIEGAAAAGVAAVHLKSAKALAKTGPHAVVVHDLADVPSAIGVLDRVGRSRARPEQRGRRRQP